MSALSFDLDEICSILDKEIRPNTMSLGVDGAQKKTGICLLRTTKTKFYVEGFYEIQMKGVGKGNLHKKLPEYLSYCKNVCADLPLWSKYDRRLIIEDCYYGMSIWTTKVLAKYAVVSFFAFKKWATDIPEPIQPITARKKVGFVADSGKFHYELRTVAGEQKRKKIWDRKPLPLKDQIINYVEENFNIELDSDDFADAFILALSGLIE